MLSILFFDVCPPLDRCLPFFCSRSLSRSVTVFSVLTRLGRQRPNVVSAHVVGNVKLLLFLLTTGRIERSVRVRVCACVNVEFVHVVSYLLSV